jgi:hypothetical protein
LKASEHCDIDNACVTKQKKLVYVTHLKVGLQKPTCIIKVELLSMNSPFALTIQQTTTEFLGNPNCMQQTCPINMEYGRVPMLTPDSYGTGATAICRESPDSQTKTESEQK